jgi:hypothetical protein
MEFSSDVEMRKVSGEAQEFFEKVLYDEEPLFVSDEATLWGVWMGDVDEVLERCSTYYGFLSRSKNPSSPSGNCSGCSMKNERLPSRKSDPLASVPPRRKSTVRCTGSKGDTSPQNGSCTAT